MPESTSSPAATRPEEDRRPECPPPGRSNLRIRAAIVGLFALVSLAVLLVSWPGYRTARHTQAAERAIEEQRWADAVPHLRAITERFPGAWLRQRQLGDALLAQGRGAEALAAYELALRSRPDLPLTSAMGRALYLADPADPRGPRLMQEGLAANPTDPEAHFYVAMYQKDQGRYREAALHFLGATADPQWHERSEPHIREIRERLLGG